MRLCPVCGEVFPSQAVRCRAHDAALVAWPELGDVGGVDDGDGGSEVDDAPTGADADRDAPQIGELTDPEVPLYAAPTPPSSVIVDTASLGAPTPRPPRVLGDRYRLGALIGIGGYGAVFDAHDERLDKRVAVKLLSPAVTQDAEIIRRFKREAIAASSVRHECIVDITDYDVEAGGTSFIVMEYLHGSDLAEVVAAEGALAPARALAIAAQCASALTAAHAAGIIHRDLKPANVFVVESASRADAVKIIDFGIAKIITADGRFSSITSASKVVGTPHYMAPEQARGEALDGRADVFALGVILFELLTGERPFAGASALEILTHAATRPRVPPSSRRAELAAIAGLDDLVVRAIAADRGQRFASMRAFGEAIVACLGRVDATRLAGLPTITGEARAGRGRGGAAAEASAPEPVRPSTLESSSGELTAAHQVRRRRRALAAGAIVAVVAAGVWGASVVGGRDRAREPIASTATPTMAATATTPPATPPPVATTQAPPPAPPAPVPAAPAPAPAPAPPPPPPSPRTITIHLTSSPSGASVSSARRGALGVTPLDVAVAADDAPEVLSLVYRGYVARSIALDPTSAARVHVTLSPPRARATHGAAAAPPPAPPPPAPGLGIKDW